MQGLVVVLSMLDGGDYVDYGGFLKVISVVKISQLIILFPVYKSGW